LGFNDQEVFIQKHGDAVILVPRGKAWDVFLDGLDSFSGDFMRDGREQGRDQE
jgi:antitoxin VapB